MKRQYLRISQVDQRIGSTFAFFPTHDPKQEKGKRATNPTHERKGKKIKNCIGIIIFKFYVYCDVAITKCKIQL